MIISTTSILEGHDIEKYLDPITSHLVAGTNYFSDLAAGFTDLFGGRSSSYQKQISNLYNDAIAELKIKAIRLKADGIIGVSIDMDEISGKGKSMFMITAIGTPVIFKTSKNSDKSSEDIVYANDIIRLKKIKELTNKINPDLEAISEDDWDFILNNSVTQLIPVLLQKQEKSPSTIPLEKIKLLTASLSDKNIIYDFLDNEVSGTICLEYIKMLRSFRNLNFDKLSHY